ncbi:hypothetical protein KXD93_17310 [Mucilaginibacter sp. BJC16-A38]|uniref:hypothetical protein n=1 Tax=Mucilaginibacter phenanthrenivorans TaxID=1234842 RepID=UPI002157EADF|nr:hypothetical protein [Mucilaginibacter phenanthrenivorans]MCR8559419.1 hypothetical protein [Mucilaginibacter phenanthrenivorans]
MEPVNNFGTSDNGKTAGIISYFTIVGWLIAYFAFHQNNRTSLGSYQLRQTLLFHIAWMVVRWGLSIFLAAVWLSTGFLSLYSLLRLVDLAFFIIWVIGLIGAIQGEKKPIPLLGDTAQTMFSSI